MKAPITVFPLVRAATDFLPNLLKEQENADIFLIGTPTWLTEVYRNYIPITSMCIYVARAI